MPMQYEYVAIPDTLIPRASAPLLQHLLDTYASETNKMISVWRNLAPGDLSFRPHSRSKMVLDILKHQLLSERRFFGEFMGVPEPPASEVLPAANTPADYSRRMVELALPRLGFFAVQSESWWLEQVTFFDVARQRIWVFWRRLLHTCHHRTQLTVYLRMMDKPVPSTYGPTADVTWAEADPTQTVEAASRR
jgi:uncharacterized damage-inducible protein DinB